LASNEHTQYRVKLIKLRAQLSFNIQKELLVELDSDRSADAGIGC